MSLYLCASIYYLPLLAFLANGLDAILVNFHSWMVPATATFALLMSLAGAVAGIPQATCRQTNVDLVAAQLMNQASPDDYIVVKPWYLGVSFHRYYQGKTRWTTLPPLDNHEFHRYDQLKERMQEDHPIQPVIDRMLETLQAGHRVWVVGSLDITTNPPPQMNPAPNNPWGWIDGLYSEVWDRQAGYAIARHALKGGVLPKVTEDCVSSFEDVSVMVFSGWRPERTFP
jgi:hypothetical protein